MYCLKCEHIFEGAVCPFCGSKKVRPQNNEDLCFLTDQQNPWSDMLSDVLRQHDIPFLKRGNLGAALATRVGHNLESYRFYVTWSDYNAAQEIVDELFGGNKE